MSNVRPRIASIAAKYLVEDGIIVGRWSEELSCAYLKTWLHHEKKDFSSKD